MDQHTGGKWLIHGTKRRKDNQLQSLELIKESKRNMFNAIFKENVQGQKHPGRRHLQNQNNLCKGSLKYRSYGN